jgi:Arc/MetJ family transcription regulator
LDSSDNGVNINTEESSIMRATVTIEKDVLDELQRETRSKNKATAVKLAIREYLRRKKIEKIKSMKGKLEFDLTADEIRHHER